MSSLPSYVASAKPVPQSSRVPWYSSTAQTYAGIMLWFVFWQQIPVGAAITKGSAFSNFAGGTLAAGIGTAILGVVIAALICHFLFYVVPGMLGMKTGLPLYIVGTSTYGVQGGFLMPGFLMGVLQFGWLAVNAYFAGMMLVMPFGSAPNSVPHFIVSAIWAIAAAFVGLKGIQYVARVATFFPIIPLAVLILLGVKTFGGIGDFKGETVVKASQSQTVEVKAEDGTVKETLTAKPELSSFKTIELLVAVIVGFFATAGAAGCDFGQNNRDGKDVQLGGLVGIAGATIFAGGMALLIVAGAYGTEGMVSAANVGKLTPTELMGDILGNKTTASVCMYLLAIAAFPPACFSSFIAANSFKTTLPKVNPFISCGIGTFVAIILIVTGFAGQADDVFSIIGASFGPICGAMAADYLLAGRQWAGPRAGFNPAGWISWAVGFAVGALPLVSKFVPALGTVGAMVPCAPLSAFVVGFVLYIVLAKIGLESKKLDMPAA